MKRKHVLISGAGIAGPALAYWLDRFGFDVTVVERAPGIREGGQAVDFRGATQRRVLEHMGLWDAIAAKQTKLGDIVALDPHGEYAWSLPSAFMSGDVEILRGDLSRLLHERTVDRVRYRFADSIAAIEDVGSAVRVTFERGEHESFDWVIGADGLRSRVRALVMPGDANILAHTGYRVAGFTLANVLGLRQEGVMFAVPGRGVMVTSSRSEDEARALFVYRGAPMPDARRDLVEEKREVREVFAGVGWEVPCLLGELDRATDLYLDAISIALVPSFSRGRVALIGDAAYGGTLGGQGTPLAIMGAYVLAGELARTPDDHTAAFDRYERILRPVAKRCQSGARRVGSFFAPKSAIGLWLRNKAYTVMSWPIVKDRMARWVAAQSNDFELPDYTALDEATRPRRLVASDASSGVSCT